MDTNNNALTKEQLEYRSRQLNPRDPIGKAAFENRSRQLNQNNTLYHKAPQEELREEDDNK